MNTRDSASEPSTPEPATEPVPVEERSNNPYPKPVRRSREVPEEPQLPGFDALTLPESSLSDMPLTKDALFEALGLTPPTDSADETEELDEIDETAVTTDFETTDFETTEIETTEIDNTDLDTTEHEIADRPIPAALAPRHAEATPVETMTIGTPPAPVATAPAVAPIGTSTAVRQGSSPAPNKRAPIWSEDWDAWIYWDTTLRTWFRHDMDQGTWVPMDED